VEVLAEGAFVVGIGLNLNNPLREGPAELRSAAVSLVDLAGQPFAPTDVLVALLQRFSTLLDSLSNEPDRISALANTLCLQRDQTLTVESNGSLIQGKCAGIAPDGALLLDTQSGGTRIVSGTLVRNIPV